MVNKLSKCLFWVCFRVHLGFRRALMRTFLSCYLTVLFASLPADNTLVAGSWTERKRLGDPQFQQFTIHCSSKLLYEEYVISRESKSSPWNTLLTTLEMHLWHTLRFVKVENSRRGMQAWIICFVPRISGSGGPESKVTLFFLQVVPLRISFHLSEFYPFSSKTTI